jgi:hypothetical protein
MIQLKDSPNNLNPIFICFNDKKFEIKSGIIQFSSFLQAAYEQNIKEAPQVKKTNNQLKTTQEIHIDELLAAIQPILFNDVYATFVLLESIYTNCTPRADSGYIAQQVQPLVDYLLIDTSNMFISNICLIADALNIPLLLNACVGAIFAKTNVVYIITEIENIDFYHPAPAESIAQILFNMNFRLFSQPRILELLEKHYAASRRL